MGQIVGLKAKPKRCNLNKLSQLGTPAAGEYILVSYDNSMTANGQGNFDRYIMGDGRTAATALELKYLDDSTRPYIVEEVNKAVADIQPIEITGDVTNAPDEEDLTSENQGGTDVLKFKDKAYNAALYSGLGRVYLRKNIVTLEGTGKNVLTQAMVNTANTIYHIQYDYDLNGQTITLPAGCVLKFDGGSLTNGTINGANTAIDAPLTKIFDTSVVFGGVWNVEYSYPEWWGDITNNIAYANRLGVTLLQQKVYYVDDSITLSNSIIGVSSKYKLLAGGARDFSKASCVCYIGDGGSEDVAGVDTNNSIFIVDTTSFVDLKNVVFFCAASKNINIAALYPDANVGYIRIDNETFSAIRFVAKGNLPYNHTFIEECIFLSFPIAINYHDLSLDGTAEYNAGSDNHIVRNCAFYNNTYSVIVNNTNLYCMRFEKCSFASSLYRHIWVKRGHISVLDGYFGPLTGSDTTILKAVFYLDENAGQTFFEKVYTENHGGVAIYDNRTNTQRNTTIINCLFLHNSSYTIDGETATIYVATQQKYIVVATTFSFKAYCMGSLINVGSVIPNYGGNEDANLIIGVANNNPLNNSTEQAIGNKKNQRIVFPSTDGSNDYIQRSAGAITCFKTGYGDAGFDFAGGRLNWAYRYDLREYSSRPSLSSSLRPQLTAIAKDSTTCLPIIFKNGIWRTIDGYFVYQDGSDRKQGTTANRPTTYRFAGQMYFDTDLKRPIWWDGSNWVDATGTTV